MLEKWSKTAERIRETWKDRFLAERVSYAIWLAVEVLARIVGDWRRVADVMGQRALFWREAGRLWKSLRLLEKCEAIAWDLWHEKQQNPELIEVYLGEMAWVYSLLGHKGTAEGYGYRAVEMASDPNYHAGADLCRRLRKLGQILIRAGKIEEARAPLEEAAQIALDESQPVAHVVHRVEALIELARYILVYSGGDLKGGWEYLKKAFDLAKKYRLWRQLERIGELQMDYPVAGGE